MIMTDCNDIFYVSSIPVEKNAEFLFLPFLI